MRKSGARAIEMREKKRTENPMNTTMLMPWAEWIDLKTNIFRNKCDCQADVERD